MSSKGKFQAPPLFNPEHSPVLQEDQRKNVKRAKYNGMKLDRRSMVFINPCADTAVALMSTNSAFPMAFSDASTGTKLTFVCIQHAYEAMKCFYVNSPSWAPGAKHKVQMSMIKLIAKMGARIPRLKNECYNMYDLKRLFSMVYKYTVQQGDGRAVFDIESFRANSRQTMAMLVNDRLRRDKRFRAVLAQIVRSDKSIFNVDPSDQVFGGGFQRTRSGTVFVGENALGDILMECGANVAEFGV